MSQLVGNGLTTTDAKTGLRIAANVVVHGDDDLNSTGATSVLADGADMGFAFFNCGAGPGKLTLSKAGYETRTFEVVFPLPTNINYELTPTHSAAPGLHLEVRGNDFVDAQGQPTCYSGVDRFNVFRLWLDGERGRIDDLIGEQLELGMNWSRIFFQGDKSQNQIFSLSPNEPRYWDQVRPCLEYHNSKGVGVLAEVCADNQIERVPEEPRFGRFCDLSRGLIVIPSGGNEAGKNGFDSQAFRDPGPGVVWSRGSGLADEVTPQNGAPCASFHQRTDFPVGMMDAVASVVYMEAHGYTVCMMDEPTRFDQDGSNKSGVRDSVRFAHQLGSIYGCLWDLAIFHCGSGQRGQLMTPALREIAAAWARGMR